MIALVPTCNRPELFQRLVSRLDGFKVFGFINNSTSENINNYKILEKNLPPNVQLVFTGVYGDPKECHVRTFRRMMNYTIGECLVIEDDVYPCNGFYNKLTHEINLLKSQTLKNFTLSPIYMPNRNSDFYTGAVSRPVEIHKHKFIDQAWVDGNFYMTADVARAMKKWLQQPVKVYRASSGVGRLNSREIHKRGWKMYTTVPTLVEHLDHDSVMFGDRRKEVPLIAKFDQVT